MHDGFRPTLSSAGSPCTDENLADIGTKGHDMEKLQRLTGLNNLSAMDVESYPETIAAALTAVAVATAAYLPIEYATRAYFPSCSGGP